MAMAVIFYEELLTSCIKLKGLIYGMRFFTVLRKCYSASKEFKIELCLIAEYISTVNLQASDRVSANDGIVVILGACILMDLGKSSLGVLWLLLSKKLTGNISSLLGTASHEPPCLPLYLLMDYIGLLS